MKKTILQIAKYYYPVEGGIETVTKYMAEGLTGFNNYVVCFSQDGITRMDEINGDNFESMQLNDYEKVSLPLICSRKMHDIGDR